MAHCGELGKTMDAAEYEHIHAKRETQIKGEETEWQANMG